RGWDYPTEFEIITAIGLLYFAQKDVDFVVLEVGLGGRLDATNVISHSLVSIITSIGFDHSAQLGNTLEEIAAEKAGIIKNKGKVVVYPQSKEVIDIIKDQALKIDAKIYITSKNLISISKTSLEGQIFS